MKALLLAAVLLLTTAAAPTPSEIEANAPAAAWTAIAADDLVVFDTPRGPFVMQLAPQFAPAHAAAIKALVRRGAFGGGAVVRVQDNYVVQWAINEKKAGPAPRGLDRYAMEVNGGAFTVNTGLIIQGPPIGTNTTGQEAEGPHCVSGGHH